MHWRIFIGLMLLPAAFSPALADPVINAGVHYLLPNGQRTIPITVSGGDMVDGLNFYIQMADGGEINEGTDVKPKITGIDIIGPGTLFSQSNRGSQPTSLPGIGGTYLIWSDWTLTERGVELAATGTLAYATIDTSGTTSADPPYALNLENVAANYAPPGFNTDFGYVPATIVPGQIVIVDLHDMKWNASGSGSWTNTTWTNPLPPYPNYTARAIVDTPYTVSVNSAQEADKLTLSNGGIVSIGSAGGLAITTDVTVSAGGALSVASGAALTATGIQLNGGTLSGSGAVGPAVTVNGGTLNAPLGGDNLILSAPVGGSGGLSKTGSGRVTLLGNAAYDGDTDISAGRLQINGLNSALNEVAGAGALGVGNNSTESVLSADSIQIGTLTIAAGSKVVINAIPGGPLSGGFRVAAVPEPSGIILLITAAMGIIFYCRKR